MVWYYKLYKSFECHSFKYVDLKCHIKYIK